MDILNNIWMAVSTPNEILTNAVVILMGIFESFLTMHLFLAILNIDSTKKQRMIYVSSIYILSIINVYFIPNPFNIFLNYFIMIILIYYIFKLTILKSIVATICPIIISGLIGSLFTNPYLTIFHISSEQMASIPIYRFGYLLIMYILTTYGI